MVYVDSDQSIRSAERVTMAVRKCQWYPSHNGGYLNNATKPPSKLKFANVVDECLSFSSLPYSRLG